MRASLHRKSSPMLAKLFSIALPAALLAVSPAPAQGVSHDPATVQDGTYHVEPVHTRVLFSLSHLGFTTWYGEFTKVSGTLQLNPKSVAQSSFEIHIPVSSLSTSNTVLDGELADPSWLDAAQFPEILFKSEKVAETGKDTAEVTGALTLHGVTKPVTLAVKFNGAGLNPFNKQYTVGFDLTGKIRRSDFGVKKYPQAIGDDVDLIISAGFEHS
jgi:polyisoprenoid-binding protein YceI